MDQEEAGWLRPADGVQMRLNARIQIHCDWVVIHKYKFCFEVLKCRKMFIIVQFQVLCCHLGTVLYCCALLLSLPL